MKISEDINKEIKLKFQNLKSVDDLVGLMSFVYGQLYPKSKTRITISKATLQYLAFSKKDRYKAFKILKKSGGEREIYAPVYTLKVYQKLLNVILQTVFTPHRSAHGFLQDRSIVSNAGVHAGKRSVYNIDLKDFFPSTSFRRVKTVLQLSPFNLHDDKEPLAFLIANLCCNANGLPQGAPTSPILTNIVCQRLDRKLLRLAVQNRASYTRYADDITFSMNQHDASAGIENKIAEVIKEEGFTINPDKTRLQESDRRQEVTGLIVNRKVNLRDKYIKQVRFWLYVWEKFGYEEFVKRMNEDYNKSSKTPEKGSVIHGQPVNILRGKINFMQMVRSKGDSKVVQFKRKFDNLYHKLRELEKRDQELAQLERIIDIWERQGINAALNTLRIDETGGDRIPDSVKGKD